MEAIGSKKEVEWKMEKNASKIEVKSMQNGSEMASEIEAKCKWKRGMEEKWQRNGSELEANWKQNRREMKAKWKRNVSLMKAK